MLELRPTCENCNKPLPPDSTEALICSYECTWCIECNENLLHNVCPNCGGGLEKRPVRPKGKLMKHPATTKHVHKPVDKKAFIPRRQKLASIPSHQR